MYISQGNTDRGKDREGIWGEEWESIVKKEYVTVSKAFTDGVKLHPIFLELLKGHIQFSHSDILEVPATSIIMVGLKTGLANFPKISAEAKKKKIDLRTTISMLCSFHWNK